MFEILEQIREKFEHLNEQLADPEIIKDSGKIKNIAKERSLIEETYNLYIQFLEIKEKLQELNILIKDNDQEIANLAKIEK